MNEKTSTTSLNRSRKSCKKKGRSRRLPAAPPSHSGGARDAAANRPSARRFKIASADLHPTEMPAPSLPTASGSGTEHGCALDRSCVEWCCLSAKSACSLVTDKLDKGQDLTAQGRSKGFIESGHGLAIARTEQSARECACYRLWRHRGGPRGALLDRDRPLRKLSVSDFRRPNPIFGEQPRASACAATARLEK